MLYDALIGPFLEFEFMRRALVSTFALAFGAAPIGVILMLRRMSLIGDARFSNAITYSTNSSTQVRARFDIMNYVIDDMPEAQW